MATPKVRGGQWGHEKFFVFPVVRLGEPDLAPAHGRQLAGLGLDHLAPRDVLDGL